MNGIKFHILSLPTTNTYTFVYEGDDGRLTYRYRPATGSLSDVTAEWAGADATVGFRPLENGGVYFHLDDGAPPVPAEECRLMDCRRENDVLVARWQCRWKQQSAEVTYTMRLW